MKFAKSIKEVQYDYPYIGKGRITIYKDEYDCFRISCEEKNYIVSEEGLCETAYFDFNYKTGKVYLADLVSFYIKEGNKKIFYFSIVERNTNYPVFIYKRDDTCLGSNANKFNLAEICFLPNRDELKEFNLFLRIKGVYGAISALSYNICINKTQHIRFRKRRPKAMPKFEALLEKCTYSNKRGLLTELLYVRDNMTDSQIYYGGLIDFYEKRLIHI